MKVNESYIFVEHRMTVNDLLQQLRGVSEFAHVIPFNKVVTVNGNFVALDEYEDTYVINDDIVRVMMLPPGG